MGHIDVLLLVAFEGASGAFADPLGRQVLGAHFVSPMLDALSEFEQYAGFPVKFTGNIRPLFGGQPLQFPKHRSLTAVTLSTHLQQAGLTWMTLDPGVQDLGYWRRRLQQLRDVRPRTIGLSTTFLVSDPYIRALLAIIREFFPESKIVLGGYYYGTNAKGFLSFDADVFCVGEGEVRFPQIVSAIRDESPLDTIPGLYLPKPGGGLRYTGRAEPLNLSTLPPVDWTLSDRIDPPIDLQRDRLEMGVETQRGCVFKCGFCTFRTLTSPNVMSAEVAADRIFNLKVGRFASIDIVDATGSYPHERWKDLLNILIARGGAPNPMYLYARVSDLSDEVAVLMAQAGVRQVFIGQESGDQRMLNIMRKGTNLKSVRPAVDALARNNIGAIFGMIHGYPGETMESAQNTRSLLLTVNDGHEGRPPVLLYALTPFFMSDMAGAAHEEGLDLTVDQEHYIGYRTGAFTPETWSRECLKTLIATSRTPHAPVNFLILNKEGSLTNGMAVGTHPYRYQIFRWMKLVERGMGIYLEQKVEGRVPDQAELGAIVREIETFYDGSSNSLREAAGRSFKFIQQSARSVMGRLTAEWANERERGPGPLTKLSMGALALQYTGRFSAAVEAYRAGTLVHPQGAHVADGGVDASIAEMAKITVDEGLDNGRQRLKIVDAEGRQISTTGKLVATADSGA